MLFLAMNLSLHGIFSALQELNVYFYNLNEIQRQKRLHRIFFRDHQSITATKNWENWNLLIYLTECIYLEIREVSQLRNCEYLLTGLILMLVIIYDNNLSDKVYVFISSSEYIHF